MNLRGLENTVAVQVAILLVAVTGGGSLVYGVINSPSGVGKIIRRTGSSSGIGRYTPQCTVQPVAKHSPVRIRGNSEIARLVIHPRKIRIYRFHCHVLAVAELIIFIIDIYFILGKSPLHTVYILHRRVYTRIHRHAVFRIPLQYHAPLDIARCSVLIEDIQSGILVIIIRIEREIPILADGEATDFRLIRVSPILVEREAHYCRAVTVSLLKFIGIDV